MSTKVYSLSPSHIRGLHSTHSMGGFLHLLHICLLDVWSWYTEWTLHTMPRHRGYVWTLCSYCSQVCIHVMYMYVLTLRL